MCAGRTKSGKLGTAFNDMTRTLASTEGKAGATERVGGLARIARRLAHELRIRFFPANYGGE